MNENINLLVKKDHNVLKEQKKLKVFRLIAGGFLVALLLTSLAIYLLNLQLSNTSLDEDRESALSDILPFRKKEAKFSIVNNRIDNISKVLDKKLDVSKIVDTILAKAPDEILVDNLEFSEKKISIKILTSSLKSVDELLNNLVDMAERKEIIKDLTLESLDVSELEGSYRATIKIGI